ncbi:MAG: hypothetical protein M3P27_06585 [Acidobacteriota bacterium]|nr:hypothetical protein [Acidobacteriota bacterium]
MQKRKIIKGSLAALFFAGALGFAVLSYMMGGARATYGFLRYALPQMRRGDLRVGDKAPDAEVLSLDGSTTIRLREKIGSRPLVLIFGSYT